MITMLTFVAHIDIGEHKTPFNTLKSSPITKFFLYPKNRGEIPKKLLDNPKICVTTLNLKFSIHLKKLAKPTVSLYFTHNKIALRCGL